MNPLTTPPAPSISPDEEFSEEEIDNNDMDLEDDVLAGMQAHVRAAMSKSAIKRAFDLFEKRANRYKRWHNWVGLFSLCLLIVALEVAVLRLVGEHFDFEKALEPFVPVVVIVGSIPFLCAAGLRCFKVHERWVLSRYRAERIRHWKFHQLLDGTYIQKLKLAQDDKDAAFAAQWDDLRPDLKASADEMDAYVGGTPFDSMFLHDSSEDHSYSEPEVFRSAAKTYFNARLRFQRKWFVRESKRYQKRDGWTKRVAGWLLSLSVITAFGEGLLHFLAPATAASYYGLGIAAVSVALALLSAGFRVYRSASGLSENAERYQRVSEHIRWYEGRYLQHLRKAVHDPATQTEIMEIMEAIERLCHGELAEFVRVSKKSEYLF